MKVKVRYSKCHIEVEGTDMECPLCRQLVKSGGTHDCESKETEEIMRQAEPQGA